MNPLYVAYYTIGTPYAAEAAELIDTLEKFGLVYQVRGVPNRGSWDANTSFKPTFLRNMMTEFEGQPLVYLDADARVLQYPDLFDTISCDVAAHWKDGHELLSGTLYLGAGVKTWELVKAWKAECDSNPGMWDQVCLDRVIMRRNDLNVVNLPAPYTLIFDSMKHMGPAIIEHTQASRRHKGAIT